MQVRGLLAPRPHLCRRDRIGHLYAYLAACRELRISTSVRAYLFRAVRNRALNRLRDQRTDGIPIEGPEPLFTNPEALQLEADEMMMLVAEAVSQLPDRCREVFRKSREEGLSNAAIADQMRISVKTVEAQITKALRRIRETLLRT
ncbi:MAG: sigma-70 family RNA polymerase sigma factor [Alistipes finegoldii]